MSYDAVSVANAALVEVGLPPDAHIGYAGRLAIWSCTDLYYGNRALLLGRLAESGPNHSAKCFECFVNRDPDRCTTVAEALQGYSCGKYVASAARDGIVLA